jgi:hypothetical protein
MVWTRTGGLSGKEASNCSPELRHGLRILLNCTLKIYGVGLWIGLNWFSIGTTAGCGCDGSKFFGFCEKQGMEI